jgi:hypothetical protein
LLSVSRISRRKGVLRGKAEEGYEIARIVSGGKETALDFPRRKDAGTLPSLQKKGNTRR